ncbi:xanthine dehydrogenase family protein molybdopterin-binding subunit [Chitinophaga agri]|uniref:Xanthine dehydrogenase family protein molybdopterin-binding subunit n=1 Tax=Chitinophaga agri TaxID=2703787 RepID=A0A6B9ZDG9_9BACT|nr:molybdopterin cofactor-binding domain-containing protein [Chitinophaga agri]QHS59185.1 xanthine dehydrogenase family protein molybdopterin-binding subunit [Chitinophaga agri]
MTEHQQSSRRNFLRNACLSGIALTIGLRWPALGQTIGDVVIADEVLAAGQELMSWISITPTGQVTIFNHRSEMGQGTWQAIPQIIAEELEVDMDQVIVQSAPANPGKYGPQPQEGSFSIRGWYQQLLRVGATAREMLITAAANQWHVNPAECYAENGYVIHRNTGRRLGYGPLVKDASQLPPPGKVALKDRKDYKIIGQPLRRNDTPAKINGSAIFGLDKKLPGMLYAVVTRSPKLRGKVKSFDDAGPKSVKGVKYVVKVQRDVFGFLFEEVAVVADSSWAAMQGRKLLTVEWDDSGFEHLDSEQLYARMHADLYKLPPSAAFETAFRNTPAVLEAVYETPYQSHSCMEPLNCTADVRDNSITIWGPIQEANWIQANLSERLQIPIENVTVNMTFLGGGFGRKAFTDYPLEAALLSKAVKAPVQVLWTREDDMSMGPFRTGAVHRCRGGISAEKKIAAVQVITASQFISAGQEKDAVPEAATVNSGQIPGLLGDYYTSIPHYSFGGISTRSPIPTMWWRAPGANIDSFACESFIDELAHLAATDPLLFRKSHLTGSRCLALTNRLAAISNWETRRAHDGCGVAITECFGSMVGQVVKVSRQTGNKIKIDKIYAVIDCGWYVNPDIIRAQIEGSIVMALGATVMHATHFKDGKAVEQNFNNYPMPRIHEIPEISVHIMENNESPGGVGEPGLPAFAPALCNAIFDLTGKRIRRLPFSLEDL